MLLCCYWKEMVVTLVERWLYSPTWFFFLVFLFYLLMRDTQRERERERGRNIGRGRSRLPTESLMQDSIPGQDPGITTWTEGRGSATESSRCPLLFDSKDAWGEGALETYLDFWVSDFPSHSSPETLDLLTVDFYDFLSVYTTSVKSPWVRDEVGLAIC